MKPIVLLLLMFGTWNLHFAQEKKILNILNRELEKEIKNQFKSRLLTVIRSASLKNFLLIMRKSWPLKSKYKVLMLPAPNSSGRKYRLISSGK